MESSYNKRNKSNGPYKKAFKKSPFSADKPAKRAFKKDDTRDEKPAKRAFKRDDTRADKPFKRAFKKDDTRGEKPVKRAFKRDDTRDEKPAKRTFNKDSYNTDKPAKKAYYKGSLNTLRPERNTFKKDTYSKDKPVRDREPIDKKDIKPETPQKPKAPQTPAAEGTIRLNKYLAQCGIAARRKADEIIAGGNVKVNGEVVREMGHRINPAKDKVFYKGKILKPVTNMIYILLNKPKDFICTVKDERDRKTVLDLVKSATEERVFPVGRLDRSTTGVLIITNDGDMMQALTHPSKSVKKVYHATLDKPLALEDMERIAAGIKLDEGVAHIDAIAYAHATDKKQIGIELHIGWNHVVRRVFEAVGYQVEGLDRVLFAGLTKKDVPRGKWRMLDEKEVAKLKAVK